MTVFAESTVEEAALEWFGGIGYAVLDGPDIAPDQPAAERYSYGDVVLRGRLREAIARLNPSLPDEAREEAIRKVTRSESPSLILNNRAFHRMLVDGVEVEYRVSDGRIIGDRALLMDFVHPDRNDWLVVNQFTVVEGQRNRRPDVVVFVNGLPLAVLELKDATDEQATIWSTFNQLQTYKQEIPSLFTFNEVLAISDGMEARIGSLTAERERFMPWRTVEGEGARHAVPLLSERRNIVVIADEAHRSQYDFVDGFARHMRDALPNASFIAFTGTPIELGDRSTRAVFGDNISVYDIQRAVEDGATVPIYYESRLARLALKDEERPRLDEAFEEITEGEEAARKEQLKTRWAALEALVGTEKRLSLVARDLVGHFENRLRAMDGKAMVVCMSRRICVDLYDEIFKLRPEWHHADDDKGSIKVVMTGAASDPLGWQQHVRSKRRREAIAKRLKNPDDPLKIVIVRDMWLTGFDVPCLHTMYVDKPMRGHGLMQAIARVNRVFRDKPGRLVVDYLGLADQLQRALAAYTQGGGQGETAIAQVEAVALMLEKYEVVKGIFQGFDYSAFLLGTSTQKIAVLPAAQEHVLAQPDGKERLLRVVTELSKAFALAVPHDAALRIADEVAFFQAVRAVLAKSSLQGGKPPDEIDHAIRRIISQAVASDEVVDIFAAAGLSKPDISILSDEFLAEVESLPQRNLAVELLQKLLNDEIETRSRKNLVQARSFAEMLERCMRAYQNRAIQTAQIIEQLIQLAKDIREARARGEALGLSDEEVAFYDALSFTSDARQVLGDEGLRTVARELVETVRRNLSIDWTVKESARAKLRTIVKRILRKYGYPPNEQEQATTTVLQQAELFSDEWAA